MDGWGQWWKRASQHPTAVVPERMVVAWTRLAVMEMGRKGWLYVAEAE